MATSEDSPLAGAWIAAAAATAVIFTVGVFTPRFNPDSWSYLELSKTIFRDFFRYNTVRQYAILSPYSSSFPPLWPMTIGAARAIGLDLGVYTGYLLNGLFLLVLLAMLMRLAPRLGMPRWAGSAAYLCLLLYQPYLTEDALAGGSIALSLVLFVGALAVACRGALGPGRAGLVGLLAGLACLTRFDYFPAALLIGAVVAWPSGRRGRLASGAAACYAAGVLVGLAPFIVYNLRHFRKPFVSDNSRQVLAAHPDSVTDYYDAPPPDLHTAPRAWAAGFISRKLTRVIRGVWLGLFASPLLALAVVWLAVGGGGGHATPPLAPEYRRFRRLSLIAIPATVLPVLLVGYGMIGRYYTLVVLLTTLMVMQAIWARSAGRGWTPWRVAALHGIMAAAAFAPLVANFVYLGVNLPGVRRRIEPMTATPEMRQLADAIHSAADGRPYRVLFTENYPAARFGALTGEPVAFPPILKGSFAAYVREWGITQIYDPAGWLHGIDLAGVVIEPTAEPNLFRIVARDRG